MDEKETVGDHATVGCQKHVICALLLRNIPVLCRTISVVCWDTMMHLTTADTLKFKWHCASRSDHTNGGDELPARCQRLWLARASRRAGQLHPVVRAGVPRRPTTAWSSPIPARHLEPEPCRARESREFRV